MPVEKIPLGINGLDKMLGGGVPKNHHVLVAGGPGTGKTSFGMQYLMKGVELGEKGVFITLEQKSERIIRDMEAAFNWDIRKAIDDGKLMVIDIDRYNFQHLMDVVQSCSVTHKAKRIVIDTLTMLRLFFKDDLEFRKGLFNLLDFLSSIDATAVITAEKPYSVREEVKFGLEEFVVDGVIMLYNMPKKNQRIRALEVLKMRGTDHSQGMFPFQITKEGIVVLLEEVL